MMGLKYNYKKFLAVPRIEKKLLIIAALFAFVSKIIVLAIPMKYYLFILNTRPKCITSKEEKVSAIRLASKTLKRVHRLVPWNSNCMVKSLTTKLLLRSMGVESELVISIIKSHPKTFIAHASIRIDKYINYYKKNAFKEAFVIS
jgi:hypothetical protein